MDNFTRRLVAVISNTDGDTFKANPDLGYHVTLTEIIYRVARINCPEKNSKDPVVKAAGLAAKDFTAKWLMDHMLHGGLFVTSDKTDDWQRYLAEVECSLGHNLSDDLLSSGNAVLYKKK